MFAECERELADAISDGRVIERLASERSKDG